MLAHGHGIPVVRSLEEGAASGAEGHGGTNRQILAVSDVRPLFPKAMTLTIATVERDPGTKRASRSDVSWRVASFLRCDGHKPEEVAQARGA